MNMQDKSTKHKSKLSKISCWTKWAFSSGYTVIFDTRRSRTIRRLKFNNITDIFQIQVTGLSALHWIHSPLSDF